MPVAAEIPLRLDAQKLMREITVVVAVRKTPGYRVRRWLGLRLLRMGAWVLGCGFEVEEAQ